jgi:DNA-binding transcriptional ArsR family regulator
VYALLYEELCVCEIAALLDTSVQTASHHLRWLNRAGLATFRKEGTLVYYRLVPDAAAVVQVLASWKGGLAIDDSVVSG